MKRRDWITDVGILVVGLAAAILTFTTLRALAEACGITGWLAWLVPVTVDAAAIIAARVWLRGEAGRTAVEFARSLAWVCVAESILGNAGQHYMTSLEVAPPWWVVVLVSAVPPATLGAVVHLGHLRTAVVVDDALAPGEAVELAEEFGLDVQAVDQVPCHVYRLFDAEDRLLYVGIAAAVRTRLTQHRLEKAWWPEVVRADVQKYGTRAEALLVELHAIHDEKPVHNVQPGSTTDHVEAVGIAWADRTGPIHSEAIAVQEPGALLPSLDRPADEPTGADKTDAELLAEVRRIEARLRERPSARRIRNELRVGPTRANRLLDQLDAEDTRRTA